ncbi:hypothetical protein CAOG_010151 [Capsaspora owczarzaki ATCC 30864]|uniref:Transmembrane protein n=1 Tax=Capsaspora owczarzaki (strain ATCC 30864) TaxID=595528 RepID=A0A0D2W0F3_CAPO3|nr:hypothetical protein CAOG_010151 [Capsaspora owczarzaki ATCC 30864]
MASPASSSSSAAPAPEAVPPQQKDQQQRSSLSSLTGLSLSETMLYASFGITGVVMAGQLVYAYRRRRIAEQTLTRAVELYNRRATELAVAHARQAEAGHTADAAGDFAQFPSVQLPDQHSAPSPIASNVSTGSVSSSSSSSSSEKLR